MIAGGERAPEVAIIGLGVIGGSAALRLYERGTSFAAYTTGEQDRLLAAAAGVPVAADLELAVRHAGVVFVAVPLDALARVAEEVVRVAPGTATLLHASSLQRQESLHLSADVWSRFVGTHPLAGSHRSGFAAASPEMFRRATVFVERRASARQRADAELFWSLAGASRIEYATADAHDRAMSWASHLPQLAATALAAALAGTLGSDERAATADIPIGPGARDATRLAMSSLEIWEPILARAPESTVAALRALEDRLAGLRVGLERGDWELVRAEWDRARQWRLAAEEASRA